MNTGKKIYTHLIEINAYSGVATGNRKPNLPEDPDYIYPTTNLSSCPIGAITTTTTAAPTTTTTTIGIRSFVVNLTNSAICPSGMCITGNQYLTTVYAQATDIAIGVQLYRDSALTQPLLNYTWIRKSSSIYIYSLSPEGVVEEEFLTCPIA